MQGREQHQHGPYLVCKPIAGQQEHANGVSDRCTLTHNTAERGAVLWQPSQTPGTDSRTVLPEPTAAAGEPPAGGTSLGQPLSAGTKAAENKE